MPGAKPVRRYALWALVAVTIAMYLGVALKSKPTLGNALAATYNVVALGLVVTYLVLYARDRRWPRVQFSIRTILVLVTLAALIAWSWRTELGAPVTALAVIGTLLYWRIWIRREEQLGCLSMALIWILLLSFIGLAFLLIGMVADGPRFGLW